MKPIVLFLLAAMSWSGEALAQAEPLTSTGHKGTVALTLDTLPDGRLAMKVVAFNDTRDPAGFSDRDIHVTTASGKRVELVPLDTLIAEVEAAARPSRGGGATPAHRPSNYGHPTMPRNSRGQLDVQGHVGANDAIERDVSARAAVRSDSAQQDEALEQDIKALKMAVLQQQTIPARSAAGGQVVVEKPKFGRREERVLRVQVEFNEEQHEFEVAVPSKR